MNESNNVRSSGSLKALFEDSSSKNNAESVVTTSSSKTFASENDNKSNGAKVKVCEQAAASNNKFNNSMKKEDVADELEDLMSEVEELQSENERLVRAFFEEYPSASMFSDEQILKYYGYMKECAQKKDYDTAAVYINLTRELIRALESGVSPVSAENVSSDTEGFVIEDDVVVGVKNRSIREAKIPLGIREIGEEAFAECKDLERVIFPDSLVVIKKKAFYKCKKLKEIELSAGLRCIDDGAFAGCCDIEKLDLPDHLTDIGAYAFSGCSSEKLEILLPASVQCIGAGAFRYCKNIKLHPDNKYLLIGDSGELISSDNVLIYFPDERTGRYVIHPEVKSIGARCFFQCSLDEVVIGDNVTSIGVEAFACSDRISSIVIPDSVTEISFGAFSHMSNLSEIVLSKSLTAIPGHAFACSGLSGIAIPDSIVKIENYAFAFCHQLENVKMHKNTVFYGDSFAASPVAKKQNIPCTAITSFSFTPEPDGCTTISMEHSSSPNRGDTELIWKTFCKNELELPPALEKFLPLILLFIIFAVLILVAIIA